MINNTRGLSSPFTLPEDGEISLADVLEELGRDPKTFIGLNDQDVRDLAGKTTPGSHISMSDLRGKSARIAFVPAKNGWAWATKNLSQNERFWKYYYGYGWAYEEGPVLPGPIELEAEVIGNREKLYIHYLYDLDFNSMRGVSFLINTSATDLSLPLGPGHWAIGHKFRFVYENTTNGERWGWLLHYYLNTQSSLWGVGGQIGTGYFPPENAAFTVEQWRQWIYDNSDARLAKSENDKVTETKIDTWLEEYKDGDPLGPHKV